MLHRALVGLVTLVAAAFAAGCTGGDSCTLDDSYHPMLDPADFQATVDNTLFPLPVGATWTYENGGETVEVEVTDQTKEILGITATVVHDSDSEDGELVEDTLDYYAQDADGNVWYLGEDTKEYKKGKVVSTEGSWEAGVDGAEPGILMPGSPAVGGDPYRQEYYACEAEDMGEVVSSSESVSVPAGDFAGCIETHDFTPLEPKVSEHKYYCPDVGIALELEDGERVELTEMTLP